LYVSIGGIDQWIEICGEAAGQPTLLFLHGGPGGPSWPAAKAWKEWEKHFTVVHWDQRGAGRTFGKNGEAGCGRLTIGRMVEDGLEVADFLRHRLNVAKLLLVGHSWGSVLGMQMIKRRPDFFSAYVGASQAVDLQAGETIAYGRLTETSRRLGDSEALRLLGEIGPPPYDDRAAFLRFRQCLDRLAVAGVDGIHPRPEPPNPAFDQETKQVVLRGAEFSRAQLFSEYKTVKLQELGKLFEVPVYFFMGTADLVTPLELAEQYLANISAPKKDFVRFEGAHHFFVVNHPSWFLRELLSHVAL